ncbi:MAG: ABC transporter permease [Flavobacteriaceae bacterium]|nr:ABC transporter permease [Flavobacteriaceae bacterium]
MNTSLYIAKRYLFSKSSNTTINVITKIATVGVIISTMALFIVLSAFSGLKTFNYQFLNTADPDLKITAVKGKSFLETADLVKILKNENIIQFSKVIEGHALLDNNGKRTAVTIKGVDANYIKVNAMDSTINIGEWITKDYKNGVVIGYAIANKIGAMPNSFQERLKIHVAKPGKGQITMKSFKSVAAQTVGIFRLTQEMDATFVFMPLELTQELLNYSENQISAIEIKLKNAVSSEKFAKTLQNSLGNTFNVVTRHQLNATFYKMLNMENLFAYLIATLIGIIAFFNVIGAIIMMILDKRANVKTLFNLGLKIKEIKKIFYLQGILLTLLGLVVGLILAIILIVLQNKFELFMITASLAYPVEFHFINLIIVIATILGLGFIAAFIASSRVSKKLIS